MTGLSTVVWAFCAACVLLFALQRWLPWSDFNLFGYVIMPWLLVGLLIGLAMVLMVNAPKMRIRRGLPIVLTIGLLGAPYLATSLTRHTSTVTSATPLRVMSFNVWLSTAGTNLDDIARVIHEENPDIVALQEMEADAAAPLQAKINALQANTDPGRAPYAYAVTDRWTEQAILSRFPIRRLGVEREQSRVLKTQVEMPSVSVQVWSIHAFRTNVLPGRNFLSYRNFNAHRDPHEQFGWLASEVQAVSEPLVLMGDFNLPYETTPLQILGLNEAHTQAGNVFDFTFPASLQHQRWINLFGRMVPVGLPFRLVRIDHILINKHWQTQTAHTLDDAAGSDHAPISANLLLR